MWETAAEWHAALNDLPVALFLASVIFDVIGTATHKDSLKSAGYWTLVAAAVGAVLALVTGLRAEGMIEHGGATHELMETHETLAKVATVALVGLAGWRTWRRGMLGRMERPAYLALAVVGAGLVGYVAHLGGKIVFRHAGGIPTSVLEAAAAERAAGHEHAEGEGHGEGDDHEHGAAEVDSTTPGAQASPDDHPHPPGTPQHRH